MNYGADDIEAITIAESIVRRPKMWTSNGTLEEVISFFEGYTMAVSHLEKLPSKKPIPNDALNWMVNCVDNKNERLSMKQIVTELRKIHGSDEKIFEELSGYLKTIRENNEIV